MRWPSESKDETAIGSHRITVIKETAKPSAQKDTRECMYYVKQWLILSGWWAYCQHS